VIARNWVPFLGAIKFSGPPRRSTKIPFFTRSAPLSPPSEHGISILPWFYVFLTKNWRHWCFLALFFFLDRALKSALSNIRGRTFVSPQIEHRYPCVCRVLLLNISNLVLIPKKARSKVLLSTAFASHSLSSCQRIRLATVASCIRLGFFQANTAKRFACPFFLFQRTYRFFGPNSNSLARRHAHPLPLSLSPFFLSIFGGLDDSPSLCSSIWR